jgi:hypothetical protein
MASKAWLYSGAAILFLLLIAALGAPMIAPHNPAQQELSNDLIAYSADHLLGTDKLGRDILSRTLYGARISLSVGMTTVALSLAIGLLTGSIAGYFGGWIDYCSCGWWTSARRSRDSLGHRVHRRARPWTRSCRSGTLSGRLDQLCASLCAAKSSRCAKENSSKQPAPSAATQDVSSYGICCRIFWRLVDPSNVRPGRRDYRRRQFELLGIGR